MSVEGTSTAETEQPIALPVNPERPFRLAFPMGAWASLAKRDVFRNASAMFGTTVVTSGFGFVFWAVAARLFSQDAVGAGSAAISAMTLIATIGMLGLGTLLIGEIRKTGVPGFTSAAVSVAAIASAIFALVYVVLARGSQSELGSLVHGDYQALLFSLGAALTGATFVIDQACIGLLQGGLQLWRNVVFSASKLLLLPLALLVPDRYGALAIYIVWALGNVLSCCTFYINTRKRGMRPQVRPDFSPLAKLKASAFAHHWVNLSSQAPRLVLPLIVTAFISAATNAPFYTALLISSFVAVVPGHLSTALFALSAGDHAALRRELRSTLRVSFLVTAAATVVTLVVGKPLLSLFGAGYSSAATALLLLSISAFPFAVKVHYMAVARVQGWLMKCAAVVTVGGVVELVFAAVGARWNMNGVAIGYLIGSSLEALILWPTVAAAAGYSMFRRGLQPAG